MLKILTITLLLLLNLQADTLLELIDHAKKNSTLIKELKSQIELSKLKKEESQSSSYGEVNLVGNYTHYNSPRTLAPLTPSSMMSGLPVTTTKDIYSVGISYKVPLFTGYATTRQLEIDSIANDISKIKLHITLTQLDL